MNSDFLNNASERQILGPGAHKFKFSVSSSENVGEAFIKAAIYSDRDLISVEQETPFELIFESTYAYVFYQRIDIHVRVRAAMSVIESAAEPARALAEQWSAKGRGHFSIDPAKAILSCGS